jgi:hypothetical protein
LTGLGQTYAVFKNHRGLKASKYVQLISTLDSLILKTQPEIKIV